MSCSTPYRVDARGTPLPTGFTCGYSNSTPSESDTLRFIESTSIPHTIIVAPFSETAFIPRSATRHGIAAGDLSSVAFSEGRIRGSNLPRRSYAQRGTKPGPHFPLTFPAPSHSSHPLSFLSRISWSAIRRFAFAICHFTGTVCRFPFHTSLSPRISASSAPPR